ncbi:DUF742 domain-containing protein [Streptomyces sp. NPDC059740]|uniref:DUF742 domain-containing protein n=1 Tax=Streptomyces sp. NPDC059740 TaxID=3346926 RepID=UPI00364A351B
MHERAGTSWYDEDAGPVVRPYAMTRGRTGPPQGPRLDPVAFVVAEQRTGQEGAEPPLGPEHLAIVSLCRDRPAPLTRLSSELDLPVAVVRVLVGDLLDQGLVRVRRPVPVAEPPDVRLMRQVIAGLRAL